MTSDSGHGRKKIVKELTKQFTGVGSGAQVAQPEDSRVSAVEVVLLW